MIGVFGGTFDPVHFGHLRPALDVFQTLQLQEMRFIPCGQPPHRNPPIASGTDRLAMLHLAIEGQPGFKVDEQELHREGPSFMVDTLESLKQETQQSLCLLLGLDAFALLPTWHRWQDIFSLSHIVVMQRPGISNEHLYQNEQLRAVLQQRVVETVAAMHEHAAGRIFFQDVTLLDISATRIRQTIPLGGSARYLVPAAVHDYMQQRHLYE